MDVIKKIFVGAYVTLFIYHVLMFAFADSIINGIWAVLLSLAVRVSGSIEIKRKGER